MLGNNWGYLASQALRQKNPKAEKEGTQNPKLHFMFYKV